MRWVGQGSLTWQVDVAEAGDYEVALCYASLHEGAQLEVVSKDSRVSGKIRKTNGMFIEPPLSGESPIEKRYLKNYERVWLEGTLSLAAGVNEVTVRVAELKAGEALDLRSLELTPTAAKQRIAAEEERAKNRRASTDWFVKSGYGLMFHWTDTSQPKDGPKKPYAEGVRDFDVAAFAEMVEETGAGYVLFTLNHAHPHCPAPIKSWEELHPGWTTQRDLVAEMADALGKRDIKFMLYIASHLVGKSDKERERNFLASHVHGKEQFDVYSPHEKVLTEIGTRYGNKLAGFWFDGWDLIPARYPSVPFEKLFEAGKTGNPDRILGLNFWIFPRVTPWQEYWAGEIGGLHLPATGRTIEYSAGRGLQFHTLLMLENIWAHSKPNTPMELPQFSAEDLINYVKECMEKQGVVTINMGIYQEGTVGKESLKVMQALRRAIRQ